MLYKYIYIYIYIYIKHTVIIKLDGLRHSCFHMYPNLQLGHAENVGPFLLRDIQSQEAGRGNRNTLLILIVCYNIYVCLFSFYPNALFKILVVIIILKLASPPQGGVK